MLISSFKRDWKCRRAEREKRVVRAIYTILFVCFVCDLAFLRQQRAPSVDFLFSQLLEPCNLLMLFLFIYFFYMTRTINRIASLCLHTSKHYFVMQENEENNKKNQKIIPRKRQFRPHVNSLAFVPLMALHKKTAAENKIWTTFSINYRIVWKIYLNWIFCVCTEPFYWLFVRRNGVQ